MRVLIEHTIALPESAAPAGTLLDSFVWHYIRNLLLYMAKDFGTSPERINEIYTVIHIGAISSITGARESEVMQTVKWLNSIKAIKLAASLDPHSDGIFLVSIGEVDYLSEILAKRSAIDGAPAEQIPDERGQG